MQGTGRACQVGTLSPRARAGPGGCPIQRSGCLAPAVQTDRQTDASFHQPLLPGCLPEPRARAARAGWGVSGRRAVSGPAGIGRAPGPVGASEVPPEETEAALAKPMWHAGVCGPGLPLSRAPAWQGPRPASPLPGSVPPALCPQALPARNPGLSALAIPSRGRGRGCPECLAFPVRSRWDAISHAHLTVEGILQILSQPLPPATEGGGVLQRLPRAGGHPGHREECTGGRCCSQWRRVRMARGTWGLEGVSPNSNFQPLASQTQPVLCERAAPRHVAPTLWPPKPASLIRRPRPGRRGVTAV